MVYTSGATNILSIRSLQTQRKASELISTFEDKQELADMVLVKWRLREHRNSGVHWR